jgi:hypothetical protein
MTKNFLKSVLEPNKAKPQERKQQLGLLMETEPLSEAEIASHQEG